MSQMQAGVYRKDTDGAHTVTFPDQFPTIPVVVLTPYWAGSTQTVANCETVTAVTASSFTFTSPNKKVDDNVYYVSWIAFTG